MEDACREIYALIDDCRSVEAGRDAMLEAALFMTAKRIRAEIEYYFPKEL
jgi:hypothetical protein